MKGTPGYSGYFTGPVVSDTFPVGKCPFTSELTSVPYGTSVHVRELTRVRPAADSRTLARRTGKRVDFDFADDDMEHQRRRAFCLQPDSWCKTYCTSTSSSSALCATASYTPVYNVHSELQFLCEVTTAMDIGIAGLGGWGMGGREIFHTTT
jgi:hypothetical protein